IQGLRGFVFAMAGDLERGLELVDEGIAASGPEEMVRPEAYVLKGDILRMMVDRQPAEAEAEYRAAVSRSQAGGGFRLCELQALTRLVHLRRETGQDPDGSDQLRALLATFTEGLGEHDVVAAARLLE
ncbi:MAG: hypothetical protein OEY62_10610, partial [Acidimicrobiia bacterium]|nr:hypothetical protein [Acidimicrobiia bacterium]